MSQNPYTVNENTNSQPQQPRRRRYQGPVDAAANTENISTPVVNQPAVQPPVQHPGFVQPQRSYQVNDVSVQNPGFARPQRSYQVSDVPVQNPGFAQPQRSYQVDDAPVQQAVLPKKPRSYQVADDAAIRNAGFTDATLEEMRLIEKVNNCSDKNLFVCMMLCLVHCHYFYVGRKGRGLLCLCTCNFFFVGMIIDLVIMACGQFKDGKGRIVHPAARLKAEIDLQNFYRQRA